MQVKVQSLKVQHQAAAHQDSEIFLDCFQARWTSASDVCSVHKPQAANDSSSIEYLSLGQGVDQSYWVSISMSDALRVDSQGREHTFIGSGHVLAEMQRRDVNQLLNTWQLEFIYAFSDTTFTKGSNEWATQRQLHNIERVHAELYLLMCLYLLLFLHISALQVFRRQLTFLFFHPVQFVFFLRMTKDPILLKPTSGSGDSNSLPCQFSQGGLSVKASFWFLINFQRNFIFT